MNFFRMMDLDTSCQMRTHNMWVRALSLLRFTDGLLRELNLKYRRISWTRMHDWRLWVRLIVWDSLTFVCTTCVTCSHVLATLECLWFWGLPSHISCWPDGVGGCQKLPTVCHFASGTHLPFFSIPKWPQNEPNFRLVILQTICSSGKKIGPRSLVKKWRKSCRKFGLT